MRVVEQGTFITGPCAGMMLADLGADVIKVEGPGGDPYRSFKGGHYARISRPTTATSAASPLTSSRPRIAACSMR